MHCVHLGNASACKELLEIFGVDVNSADYDRRTALHIAAADGNVQLTQLLLERGASVGQTDRWGRTAQDDALYFKHDDVLAVLREHGASVEEQTSQLTATLLEAARSNDCDEIKRIVYAGINVNICDYDQRTALHIAAGAGSLSAVKLLMLLGAEPRRGDKWGNIPLDDAKAGGHTAVIHFLQYYSRDHNTAATASSNVASTSSNVASTSSKTTSIPPLGTRRAASPDSTGREQEVPSGSEETSLDGKSGKESKDPKALDEKSKHKKPHHRPTDSFSAEDLELISSKIDEVTSATLELELDKFDIAYESLQFERELSHGAFGVVSLGRFKGQQVAIKEIRSTAEDEQHQLVMILQLRREIASLSRIAHPNIVKLLGVSFSPPKVALVTEFIPGSTLMGHLKRYSQTSPTRESIVAQAIDFGCQIARGMAFSHRLHVVHRDLKSPNVMIEENTRRVVIIDFGSARVSHIYESHMTAGVGSFRWIAPELFQSSQYNEKVDVYSFAIMLWELLHPGQIPLAHYSPVEAAIAAAHRAVRPQITLPLSRKFLRLLRSCWSASPADRPAFRDIVKVFETKAEKLAKEPQGFSLLNIFRS